MLDDFFHALQQPSFYWSSHQQEILAIIATVTPLTATVSSFNSKLSESCHSYTSEPFLLSFFSSGKPYNYFSKYQYSRLTLGLLVTACIAAEAKDETMALGLNVATIVWTCLWIKLWLDRWFPEFLSLGTSSGSEGEIFNSKIQYFFISTTLK